MGRLGKLWAGYKKYRLVMRMIAAVIGVIVGCSASIVFGRVFENVQAAAWAAVSAVFAALYFKTNLKVHRDVQRSTPVTHFTVVKWLGFVGFLAGVAGFVTYLVLGVKTHERGVDVKGYFIVTVWTLMTSKWGILTVFGARRFERMYAEDRIYEGIIVNSQKA